MRDDAGESGCCTVLAEKHNDVGRNPHQGRSKLFVAIRILVVGI